MRRRKFIKVIAGSAAAWPVAAFAQQGERMRRVSVLMSYVESDTGAQKWAKAFDDSLQELGWNKGRNIQLDYRWAGPNPDRLRGDAEELVRLSPDVLFGGATPAVIALQHATRSIPIVFERRRSRWPRPDRQLCKPRGQYNWIWGFRFFDSREMGSNNQRNCTGGGPNRGDIQSRDRPL